jgi:hypothetical protein
VRITLKHVFLKTLKSAVYDLFDTVNGTGISLGNKCMKYTSHVGCESGYVTFLVLS